MKAVVGKRTRGALYVHSSAWKLLPLNLRRKVAAGIGEVCVHIWTGGSTWLFGPLAFFEDALLDFQRGAGNANFCGLLVKLPHKGSRISFLYYPNFDTDTHPVLAKAIVVDTARRVTEHRPPKHAAERPWVQVRNYTTSTNPPILHRKEEFVARDYPLYEQFAAITRLEEGLGLYAKSTLNTIGTLIGWEKVVCRLPLALHKKLTRCWAGVQDELAPSYRTAMRRRALSVPACLAFAHVIRNGDTVLDYGCGRGDDVKFLTALRGVRNPPTCGYDPYYLPHLPHPAEVVLLTYVLSVVVDPQERAGTLRAAFRLARRSLVVAVRTDFDQFKDVLPYKDGFLSGKRTFQRPYKPDEFGEYVSEVLDRPVQQLAPGIVVVEKCAAQLSDGVQGATKERGSQAACAPKQDSCRAVCRRKGA